jgi:hypothetical protein
MLWPYKWAPEYYLRPLYKFLKCGRGPQGFEAISKWSKLSKIKWTRRSKNE